jgi:hypothetical protein
LNIALHADYPHICRVDVQKSASIGYDRAYEVAMFNDRIERLVGRPNFFFLAMSYCHTHPLLLEYGIDLGWPPRLIPGLSPPDLTDSLLTGKTRIGVRRAIKHLAMQEVQCRTVRGISEGISTHLSAPAAPISPKDGTWQLACLDSPGARQVDGQALAEDGTSL